MATAPMNFGEKVVLRILDKRKAVLPRVEFCSDVARSRAETVKLALRT
jgi:hypothetical protein